MKTLRSTVLARWMLAALLTLALPACATFHFRDVQSDFQDAVRADIEERNAVVDRSQPLYRDVVAKLTLEKIGDLDSKLQANAWMIRAYAEWRLGDFEGSKQSAENGLRANPVPNSRDDVVLHLIPALLIDSEVTGAWRAAGAKTDPATYQASQEKSFGLAVEKVDEAKARFGPATPDGTKYYVEYQRWRILQNWRTVITKMPRSSSAELAVMNEALARAKDELGNTTLDQAAANSRDAIPASHFLRQQIAASGGG